MLTINDLKVGTIFKYQNEPYEVLKSTHTHMGRGGATVSVKIKSLSSGKVLAINFKSADKFAEANIEQKQITFLYQDEAVAYFMDENYEQFNLPLKIAGLAGNFLKNGEMVNVSYFEDQPIKINLPIKIKLKVAETEPGAKGNTANGAAYKSALLETGWRLQVPLFIKEGDLIVVNTEKGEYVERAT